MNYTETLEYLYALGAKRDICPGKERIQSALESRDHPERGCRMLHIAGTNGKGSVAAMLASVLEASGARVGLYTSPHLHQYTERIQINGTPLACDEIATRVTDIRRWMDARNLPPLSFFEITTWLAFEAFQDHRCDWVVLETGLGGRLDATNVVDPVMTFLTPISIDHEMWLGKGLETITKEKCGIIKANTPVINGANNEVSNAIVGHYAREKKAPIWHVEQDRSSRHIPQVHAIYDGARLHVETPYEKIGNIAPPLQGVHQRHNVTCTVAGISWLKNLGYTIPDSAIHQGLENTKWPGRLEKLSGNPNILLDVAHNPQAMQALTGYLQSIPGPKVAIASFLSDKPWQEMLQQLQTVVSEVHFAPLALKRAVNSINLAPNSQIMVHKSPQAALAEGMRITKDQPEATLVITGSIFLVAELRAHLLDIESDPPITL